jgi:hypothetical protein
MTIPLDRLYHYVLNIVKTMCSDHVIIYRFWPHGSKNINDLTTLLPIANWAEEQIALTLRCYDQEPLQYDFYKNSMEEEKKQSNSNDNSWDALCKSLNCILISKNLNFYPGIFEKTLLLHSEKRSHNLKKYHLDGDNIPVYYWSHAVISLDWFRYAQHETFHKNSKKTFLIYNRSWSGSREYRLKFAELLFILNLQDCCNTSINAIEPELGIHYSQHKFKNLAWKPTKALENYFPINTAKSYYSADFCSNDYNSTDIEIVLETLFDDDRLHLTEKSLRPIACAQPFILAGTHGSLEYLRSYGFKTFDTIWDENYDLVEDPEQRLICIADLMKQITMWSPDDRLHKLKQAQIIADYNRQHFFSQEFFKLVTDELTTNLKLAVDEFYSTSNYQTWIDRWNQRLLNQSIIDYLNTNQNPNLPDKSQVDFVKKIVLDKLNNLDHSQGNHC